MLYRVLKNLDTGHRPGDLVDESTFSQLDRLVKAGALAKAKSPPLAELPGWATRAEKLAIIGIVTVEDLLGADPQAVQDLFNHKNKNTFNKWQDEARSWLRIEPKSN